eukprot:620172-Pelagomonas_calceolata.AAC.1
MLECTKWWSVQGGSHAHVHQCRGAVLQQCMSGGRAVSCDQGQSRMDPGERAAAHAFKCLLPQIP